MSAKTMIRDEWKLVESEDELRPGMCVELRPCKTSGKRERFFLLRPERIASLCSTCGICIGWESTDGGDVHGIHPRASPVPPARRRHGGRRDCDDTDETKGSGAMSWDFRMASPEEKPCPTCGHTPERTSPREANYTYNVSPMFYEAFGEGGIRSVHGLTGDAALPKLRAAIAKMESDPDKYKAMNPPNGLGSYEGALVLLRKLAGWCAEEPKSILEMS